MARGRVGGYPRTADPGRGVWERVVKNSSMAWMRGSALSMWHVYRCPASRYGRHRARGPGERVWRNLVLGGVHLCSAHSARTRPFKNSKAMPKAPELGARWKGLSAGSARAELVWVHIWTCLWDSTSSDGKSSAYPPRPRGPRPRRRRTHGDLTLVRGAPRSVGRQRQDNGGSAQRSNVSS